MKKNRILILIILIIVAFAGYMIFCPVYTSQNEILRKALYFDKKAQSITQIKKFKIKVKNLYSNEQEIFKNNYSHDNFSFFFITLKFGLQKKYELNYSPGKVFIDALENYIKKYKTVCTLEDITEQKWDWNGKSFSGSFCFKTPFDLQGRCLFEGKNEQITKMVIAQKGSDKLEEGYAVFGCKYGLNPLAEEDYDEAVSLPESKVGQYITYNDYNPNSLTISIRQNGNINVNGRIISASILDTILKNAQKQFKGSNLSIFLRIDKDCPQLKTAQLIELIKPYNFKIYQVFNKQGEYYPIAKEISQRKSEKDQDK